MGRPPPISPLFPYTTLFRSRIVRYAFEYARRHDRRKVTVVHKANILKATSRIFALRSEEHTSELQSRFDLVCRLLLEKKKTPSTDTPSSQHTSTALSAGANC